MLASRPKQALLTARRRFGIPSLLDGSCTVVVIDPNLAYPAFYRQSVTFAMLWSVDLHPPSFKVSLASLPTLQCAPENFSLTQTFWASIFRWLRSRATGFRTHCPALPRA